MINVANLVGIGIGMKLVNGKFKPKVGKSSIFAVIFFILMFIGCAFAFVYNIINFNLRLIILCGGGMYGIIYMLLISHVLQPAKNYYITFQSEESLEGFELLYKDKKVNILYTVDAQGKIMFADNAKKTNCVSYADGSKMSKMTKYRIVNYFAQWLIENNLMSDEVTVSLEY